MFIEDFQKDRSKDRADEDHEQDSREIVGSDESGMQTFLRRDKSDLASGHHADTDLKRVVPVEFAEF